MNVADHAGAYVLADKVDVESIDWAATSLGPRTAWPTSLGAIIDVMLVSRQAMFVACGPQRLIVYNDAYAPILGQRHPAAFGQPIFEVWPEAGTAIEPILERAFAGEPVHVDDIRLVLNRNGYAEEAHFAFSYTPVSTAPGSVGGVLCICTETTAQMLAEGRQGFRIALDDALRGISDPREVMAAAARLLGRHLRVDRVGYAEIDATNESFDVERDWTDDGMPSLSGHHRLDDFGPALIAAFRAGRTISFDDALSEPLTRGETSTASYAAASVRAAITVPLVKDGRFAAALFVHARSPRRWTREDDLLVGDVAERTWSAVERARAEAGLRESEERFRNMADNAPVMMWVTDPTGYCTYLNGRWYAFTGQSEGEAEGYGWLDATHPDDRTRAEEAFLSANAARAPFRVEYRLRRADGAFRWAIDSASPRFGEDGDFLGYVGSVIDIDERREAEDRLRASEARFRAAVDAVQGVLWTNDATGRMRGEQPGWSALTGQDRDAYSGYGWSAAVHPEDAQATVDAWNEAVAERRMFVFEHRVRRHDGVWRIFSIRAIPTCEDDGTIREWVGVHTDVTDRRAAEMELRDLADTLEQRVADEVARRGEIEEALRQSQKMEAVGQLTGGLAHDFNNLLTGISGSLELMQTRIGQGRLGDIDRYVNAAQGASRRAAALTHRLLAFSRRQTLAPKPTDINRLVEGLEDLISRTVGPSVETRMIGSAGLWTALVDPNQLENAVLNLCINGRDAMPDGGLLTVETANRWLDGRAAAERDVPPGQYLSLCVSDTGTGMSPEVAARAFDPFFTTKPLGEGTGLGLSMIYGFARQSGGQARIYSEPGAGTTVCLYLPRHVGASETVEPQPEIGAAHRADVGQVVLVVDDEATVRMLVTEVLEDLGYTAIEAKDGATGLAVLRAGTRIDLLVTDVGLPGGMNGRQVADAGRVLRPGLKVLFITGYAENAVLGNGHLEPGMQVLTKPFPIEAIAARIKAMLEKD